MKLNIYDNGDRNSNKIAMTFDDGPNPFWTEKILEVLDEYSVKANFFILGKYAEQHKDIVKKIFDRGHLIGNHSYSHLKTGVGEFDKAEEIIFNITGEHTKFIRPPSFLIEPCYNYEPAREGKIKIINCDLGSGDWDWNRKSEEILKTIVEKTQNGSIILFHDGSQREEELEYRPTEMFKILPKVIENLKKRFDIVRLDNLTLVPAEKQISGDIN
jgi:peptidoglycan/xylan/chitin deacetylase (PgdA/CDA1 family)